MIYPTYLPGIYRITPMGAHTAFDCVVTPHNIGYGYVLSELWEPARGGTVKAVDCSVEMLTRMQPQFLRKLPGD